MVAKKIIPPDVLAEAQRLYEQTAAPVGDIAAMVGLSRSNLYQRVRELGWRSRRARPTFNFASAVHDVVHGAGETQEAQEAPTPVVPAVPAVPLDAKAVAQQRVVLAQRMLTVAEREMDAIERIVAVLKPSDPLEAEHGARTLASVSRTLRDIKTLTRLESETPSDDAVDDPVPRDIDEFRNELARRIRILIEEETVTTCDTSGIAEAALG